MEFSVHQFLPAVSGPIAWHHLGVPDFILLTPSLLVFIDTVPPQLSHLSAEQTQLTQPFLVIEVLQSLNHLCSLLLGSLKELRVSFVLRSSQLDTLLHMQPPFT